MHASFVPPWKDTVPRHQQREACRLLTCPGIEKHKCSHHNSVHRMYGRTFF